jgi:hypothetical protein
MSTGAEPTDDNGRPIVGWDITNHRPAVPEIDSTGIDTNGVVYGTIKTSSSNNSGANPVITEDQIRALIAAGQGFSATTGKQTSGGAIQTGLSLFNPVASGKTLLVYSAKCSTASNGNHQLNTGITTDPALGTPATITNRKGSGGASPVASVTYANVAVTAAGTMAESEQLIGQTALEYLSAPGDCLYLPAGTGIELLLNTSTNAWMATVKWLEF